MRREHQYETIRATELESAIASLFPAGCTRAEYTHGTFVRTVHLVGSERMLTIALTNSGVDRLEIEERDALLERIAKLGIDWLRARSLAVRGTLVSVSLNREVDLKLVSWGWGGGGRAFWIDERGELTTVPPPAVDDDTV